MGGREWHFSPAWRPVRGDDFAGCWGVEQKLRPAGSEILSCLVMAQLEDVSNWTPRLNALVARSYQPSRRCALGDPNSVSGSVWGPPTWSPLPYVAWRR